MIQYPVGYLVPKERRMELDAGAAEDVVTRLRRVEGQIGGIIRMIEEGRECRDVIQQVAAAGKALDRAGFRLLSSQLRACLADEEAAAAEGYGPEELEKLFSSLA
jgi:DNA-binding FrmR family transcriptional regulator